MTRQTTTTRPRSIPTALIVGLDPGLLDHEPTHHPEPPATPDGPVDSNRVRTAMDDALHQLHEHGIDGALFLLPGPTDETLEDLGRVLADNPPDAVMIGAGVRLEPDLSWFLERMVNTVIDTAPGARLCFNETPEAMATAVLRVLSTTSPAEHGTDATS